MNEWMFKVRFNRVSYPTVKSCMDYFKRWQKYKQVLQLIKEENFRFSITTIYIYFYCYTKQIDPDTLKVSSITDHNGVYYYYTRQTPSDEEPHKMISGYFPGFTLQKSWDRTFEELDRNLSRFKGIYNLGEHNGSKAIVHTNTDEKNIEAVGIGALRIFLTKSEFKRFPGFAAI